MKQEMKLNGEALGASQENALEVELFLQENYLFRRNVLSGKVEFVTLPAEEPHYRVLTQEALNSIVIRAKRENVCEKGSPKAEIISICFRKPQEGEKVKALNSAQILQMIQAEYPSVKSDRSTMIHLGLAMKELGIDHLLYNNKRVYKVVPLKSA